MPPKAFRKFFFTAKSTVIFRLPSQSRRLKSTFLKHAARLFVATSLKFKRAKCMDFCHLEVRRKWRKRKEIVQRVLRVWILSNFEGEISILREIPRRSNESVECQIYTILDNEARFFVCENLLRGGRRKEESLDK